MNTRHQSIQAWIVVRHRLADATGIVTIPKTAPFPHPRDAGALPTTTWPVGQLADYVLELELGSVPLLIREFSDRYEAFLATAQLTTQVIRLLEANPTAGTFIGAVLVGAVIGAAVTKKSEGALVGAGLGLVVAALVGALQQKEAKG